ncbi:hypothetical protein NIES2101_37405 [Calothrix sp. HK-06]|nr:hypothetical protein NIES2101_37405 [Calothrix sp. HK-06]
MARAKKSFPITDPTGEKAAAKAEAEAQARKEQDELVQARVKARMDAMRGVGAKAAEVANTVGTVLQPVSNVINKGIDATVNTGNSLISGNYSTIQTNSSYTQIESITDVYSGIAIPQVNFDGLIPTDLLNPSGLPQCTEQKLQDGLKQYASATNAQKLYQAGFKYISEVGKTKQEYHKAQQSIIKASTEEVKVQREVTKFDTQNVELVSDREKLYQADERLKQQQIITQATRTETSQLIAKVEATEQKRNAEIEALKAQTNEIVSKYLTKAI